MRLGFCVLILSTFVVAGCSQATPAPSSKDGRYVGVGIYSADEGWARVAGAPKPQDAATATPAHDGQIIVVIDSQTGEVRQCGNLSGRCVSLNPWMKAAGDADRLPVKLLLPPPAPSGVSVPTDKPAG